MYELLWTVLGMTIAIGAMRPWRRRVATNAVVAAETPIEFAAAADPEPIREPIGEPAATDPASIEPIDTAAAERPPERDDKEPEKVTLKTKVTLKARHMALALAEEIADHVTAVEGRAHYLIEAAPTRTQLPAAAEALLASVERMRTLHTKLVAFGRARGVESGATDVPELIASLRDEVQLMQLGLEVRWEPPPELPCIDASTGVVRDALLFVCSALLHAERGATRMTFTAEQSFSRERPTVKVEVNLEWTATDSHVPATDVDEETFVFDLEAAKHLIESHGGELTLSRFPGKAVQAVVRMPTAVAEQDLPTSEAEPTEARPAGDPHHFGGALVLESDPALRAVLARELKASGRAVFACADGASAHTFLETTPDRFELLIVDDVQQLDDHMPLARTIRKHTPDLKICLLTPTPTESPDEWPGLHCLKKPFGVHELRRTLASILPAG